MYKSHLSCVFLLLLADGFFGNRFQINLIKELSSTNLPHNFVISPFAIHQALALLYLDKDIRKDYQLANALRFTGRRSAKIVNFFGKARWKANRQHFVMANRIYFSPDYNVSQNTKKINKAIGVDVEHMNFTDGHKSGDEIKKWLSKTIEKASQNIFDKNYLTNSTQLVALQGMSMSCLWKHRAKSLTKQSFSIARPNKAPYIIRVDMMYTKAPFEFFNDDEVRGVMIPFSRTDIGMLVLIPRRYDTQKVLQNLDKYLQIKMRRAEETHLFLPLFTVQDTMDLNTALKAVGIKNMFNNVDDENHADAANFKQYNFLEVKPNRVLIKADVGSDNDQRVVKVNQAFVFVIKDQSNIYMVGRMENI
ncbi:hypothetical protein KR084_009760 [Drosophila pseudotakahashii]|nr:hypothetical protein KR084_009760 [Drosophila pseudotakahashii]